MCVSVERVHEQGDEAVRPGADGQRVLGGVDAEGDVPGGGDEPGRGAAVGCDQVQEGADDGRAPDAGGDAGMELALAVVGEPGSEHPAAGREGGGRVREQAGGAQVGGVRAEVVARRSGASVGRERQPAVRVEPAVDAAGGEVQRAHGCREGDRVVPAPARAAGIGRGDGGPVHPVLEHGDEHGAELLRHGEPGVQPGVVEERERAGEHARVFAEPDHRVEVPDDVEAGDADGAHNAGAVSGDLAGRSNDRDGGRG